MLFRNIVFLLLFSFTLSPLLAQNEKQILIINSYHRGFQWSDDVISGIEETLYSHPNITSHILYMDSKRISSDEYYNQLRKLYKIQLKKQKYDLILAIDKFAYDFVLKNYQDLFSNQPVLFTGLEQFSLQQVQQYHLENKVYGVKEKRNIDYIITMIAKMIPHLKKLYIVNDNSANGDDSAPFIQEAIDQHHSKFAITYIRKSTIKKLEKLFANPNPDEAVFFIRFYNDEKGAFYKNSQIAAMINQSKLPVFVTDTLFIKKGAFGGKLVSINELGKTTGNMAIRILTHQPIPQKVITDDNFIYQFDAQKIKQFHIYPSSVLKKFDLVNVPLTFFDKNRHFINFVFSISPLLVLLIIGLLYNIYKRIKSEKELQKVELQKNKHQQFIIQQSKLAEIGEIFSSIAHQWKNPLVEIATIAQEQVYNDKNQASEENNQYIHDIMIQVQYMTDTIQDFQDFIMPSLEATIFDINEAVTTMFKIINHNIKYNYIDVVIENTQTPDFKVCGYKNEFMQTLLNIVNNAKDQIREQRLNKIIKRGKIKIKMFHSKEKIIVEISDNGGGIATEKLDKIFDAYFTTKEHGHGIGLYMSKLIIEDKMHGQISVRNIPDGACFTIILDHKQ